MTKAAIIEKMKYNGLTGTEAEKAFTVTINSIKATISTDGRAAIPGFGVFTKKHVEERKGHNPATREPITIAAHEKIAFKESKSS